MIKLISFILLLSNGLLFASIAQAKLASTTFQDLVSNSDIIVVVETVEIKPTAAKMDIIQILKGSPPETRLVIRFDTEEHEQTISGLGRRVLFLRKTQDDSYTATSYGKSYWPLMTAQGSVWATPYIYPMTLVRLQKENLLDNKKLYSLGQWHSLNVLTLDKIVGLIEQIKK